MDEHIVNLTHTQCLVLLLSVLAVLVDYGTKHVSDICTYIYVYTYNKKTPHMFTVFTKPIRRILAQIHLLSFSVTSSIIDGIFDAVSVIDNQAEEEAEHNLLLVDKAVDKSFTGYLSTSTTIIDYDSTENTRSSSRIVSQRVHVLVLGGSSTDLLQKPMVSISSKTRCWRILIKNSTRLPISCSHGKYNRNASTSWHAISVRT